MHKYIIRKPVDKYHMDKEYKSESPMAGFMDECCETRPTNINGVTEPCGNSAADQSKNLRIAGEEMKQRVGC